MQLNYIYQKSFSGLEKNKKIYAFILIKLQHFGDVKQVFADVVASGKAHRLLSPCTLAWQQHMKPCNV